MRLGEILVQLGLLTPEQLKGVLDSRDLFGGRIGTQIVQRGLLDTDQISEGLGRQMRMPAALQRHFDKADPAVVAMLKPNLAARYMAIPLVAARSGVKRIVVAMATPQDMLVVDDVAFALGARVEPMISAELAIARNLKRLYNVEVNLSRPARADTPANPSRSPASHEFPAPAGPVLPPFPSASEPAAADSAPVLAPPLDAAVSLEDAVHRLSVCEHRDQIADILIDFMLPRFGCGIIFLLREGSAQAWRGYAQGIDARAVETVNFPMSVPSMFRLAQQRAATFRGPPPPEGSHLHAQIWKYLQCQVPTEVVVIPIAIAERVVILVYAHGSDGGRLPESYVQELQAMCTAAGSSFVRLIQQAKEGKKPPTLVPL
ncbi:MAG: hypothetical protein JXP73_09760 [Deltaproteobacteria bacterium]|nr:hypothetical protein [Deltaproteobacteria bacterium]